MSEPEVPAQEEVQRMQRRLGISREQANQVYQESLQLSQYQIQRGMQATSNFITTVVALLSSAVGIVAALAWNDAISAWLPTISILSIKHNVLAQKFTYAFTATIFAVVVIAVLGIINSRIKGRNLMTPTL